MSTVYCTLCYIKMTLTYISEDTFKKAHCLLRFLLFDLCTNLNSCIFIFVSIVSVSQILWCQTEYAFKYNSIINTCRVKEDMDEPTNSLMGAHGYCTQVNTLYD